MHDQVDRLIALALAEDIGTGDVTAATVVPADTTVTGILLAKESGVLAGLEAVDRVFRAVDPRIAWEPRMADGDALAVGVIIGRLSGAGAVGPDGGADGPQPAAAAVGRRDGDAPVRRRGRGDRARRSSTRARRRRGCGCSRRRPSGRRRVEPPGRPLRRHPDQGQPPRGRRRRRRARRPRARAGAPHTLRVEVEIVDLDQLEPAIAAGADIVMLDTWTSRRCGRRSRGSAAG
jgi:nicotinate-nucleotide pyrophosphorylase (carboxylating)